MAYDPYGRYATKRDKRGSLLKWFLIALGVALAGYVLFFFIIGKTTVGILS